VLALHQAVDKNNRGFTPALGVEIARAAAGLEPAVAVQAATRALEGKGLAPELASEMSALVAKLQPDPNADDAMAPPPVTASVKFEDEDAHDRSAFGAVDDLSAEPEAATPAPAAGVRASELPVGRRAIDSEDAEAAVPGSPTRPRRRRSRRSRGALDADAVAAPRSAPTP
jgi:hypothetical protein